MLNFSTAVNSSSLRLARSSVPSRRARSREVETQDVPVYNGEFWTASQRQASSIHEVSYRACFKPQLPAYFINQLTEPGDRVYDPFAGRGTTAIEAALLGRNVIANDVNPLSAIFIEPRLELPELADIEARLATIQHARSEKTSLDLSMFYHRDTARELMGLRNYLNARRADYTEDGIDRWIRMVATKIGRAHV